MRRQRFTLIQTTCRRCGQPVTTGSRSLYGMDATKAQFDRICSSCITPEEREAIDKAFRQQMPQVIARGL